MYAIRSYYVRKDAIKCPECNGYKYVSSIKTSGKILSYNICQHCEGTGNEIVK